MSVKAGKSPEFWACYVRPAEVRDWSRRGWGFDDFDGWLKRLGVTGIRVGAFSWAEIEVADGKFDFNSWACPLDDTMERLVKLGFDIYLNPQCYSWTLPFAQSPAPSWALRPSSDKRLPEGTLVPDPEKFDRFVRALANRYGKAVRLWGWGNENDAASDPIGGLVAAFDGDWTVPALTQYYEWSLPFAQSVRRVIPGATVVGPETMTYGYAATMLTEDNKRPATDRAFDIASVHGYAMDGQFPQDALDRIDRIQGSLQEWMTEGGALGDRPLMLGEMGIEHGEDPRGLLTYLSDPRIDRFTLIAWLGLDNFLTVRDAARPKALTPNALYEEVRAKVASMASVKVAGNGKKRAVRTV